MKALLYKRVAAILFALLMGCVLGLVGLAAGSYFWGHFGPPPVDVDDVHGYLFSLVAGGLVGAAGIAGSLWMFWPRVAKNRVSLKVEVLELTTDELLKRMPKDQAIDRVERILRHMEKSMDVPDIPAAKARLEKVLEELNTQDPPSEIEGGAPGVRD
jgi:hypothetical protein